MTTYANIHEITPDTPNWRAKVIILEKNSAYRTDDGRTIQKLFIADEFGNRVQGIIWNKNIELLQNILQPFMTYTIGNADIGNINSAYLHAADGTTIEWRITRSTFIRSITDKQQTLPYPHIEHVLLTDLPQYVCNGHHLDILAAVVAVQPPKQREIRGKLIPIQECTIIQQDLRPLLLSLWGSFVANQGTSLFRQQSNMPIILAKRLRASSFSGISLNTSGYTYMAIDPNISQAKEFRNWIDNNIQAIHHANSEGIEDLTDLLLSYYENEEIVPVSYIEPDSKNAWVQVAISITDLRQEICYMACPQCMNRTEALPNEIFLCTTCQRDHTALPRCKVQARLTDKSGSITATFFDKNAEILLHRTASELHRMQNQGFAELLNETEEWLKEQTIIAEVKAQRNRYRDRVIRYTVQKWSVKDFTEISSDNVLFKSSDTTTNSDVNMDNPSSSTAQRTTSRTKTLRRQINIHNTEKMDTEYATAENTSPSDAANSPKKLKLKTN